MTVQRVYNRVITIVLDGFGVGELPDADRFGDVGANTASNLANKMGGLHLPHLEKLGLGNIETIHGVSSQRNPIASFGKAAEKVQAKDSVMGHWEIMDCVAKVPFATFPEGFPEEMVREFCQRAKLEGVLGNKAASGTDIIEELGEEHIKTKKSILYTSVDSVFQIAAHTDVIPVEKLYQICSVGREICNDYNIARVIARPFEGTPGAYKRTYQRKDFAMAPPSKTALNQLQDAGIKVIAVGKIKDLFSNQGIDHSISTEGNRDGMAVTTGLLEDVQRGFIFTNLIDFDSSFGHRRDPQGFAQALAEFDDDLGVLMGHLKSGDLLIITADHGNDPTFTKSTDHTREYVPILIYDPDNTRGRDLGVRKSFADIGKTVLEAFGVKRSMSSLLPIQ